MVTAFGRKPDFLCDNAPEKWNKYFSGVKCISPSALEDFDGNVAVVITIKNHEVIFEQLVKMGINEIYLALYKRVYNAIDSIVRLPIEVDYFQKRSVPVNSVQGKWTLVTGASRGCGRLIAREMARLGSNVILHARCKANTKKVCEECLALGVQTHSVAARLEIKEEIAQMLMSIDQSVPNVDIIFNNAGISPKDSAENLDCVDERFNRVFAVNTIAPIIICYHFFPKMADKGFGRIVNVTSSIQKRPKEIAYACSKEALNKFVYDYAPSLRGSGVMMSLVDPGWMKTDMGGPDAPHPVESVFPGILLGAILDYDVNGQWIGAQEYRGMNLEQAAHRAMAYMSWATNSNLNKGDEYR